MKGDTISRNGWWYFQLLRYRNRKEDIMLELCGTAIFIAVLANLTRILIKAMELAYLRDKNEREGKYVN